MIQTDIHWEITDTYGGEANYSWVKRGKIQCNPGEDYSGRSYADQMIKV